MLDVVSRRGVVVDNRLSDQEIQVLLPDLADATVEFSSRKCQISFKKPGFILEARRCQQTHPRKLLTRAGTPSARPAAARPEWLHSQGLHHDGVSYYASCGV
ncbi:hypothetical protein ElyMa_006175100 [Elysia marginata]|uniref:Uncharacterized protein n=1 Tax=Elysia marginata TaxID=1093978 RepID=A0AAV4H1S4_9GAST|nr:hypothetical protein ElyMa_006175100 [Elysia marginata]